jgi:hypothetical protein
MNWLTCWDWLALAVVVNEIGCCDRYVTVNGQYPSHESESLSPLDHLRRQILSCSRPYSPDGSPVVATPVSMDAVLALTTAASGRPFGVALKCLPGSGISSEEVYEIELDVVCYEQRPPKVEIMVTWKAKPSYRPPPVIKMFPLEEVQVCLDYLEENP